MDQRKKLQLKKLLKSLDGFRARHTELITVYIPSGYAITSVTQQLMQEQGTAENIKSKTTRKNVQTALEKMVRQLRTYKATPHNGLALFSGNVSESEGGIDFKIFAIEPPMPLNIKIYKCDQAFYLDPLKDILLPTKTYGLVVIDRQAANIAVLKGTTIQPLYEQDSLVPGKTRKGGQCLHPNTLVNTTTKIKDLKVGDVISSINIASMRIDKSIIKDKWIVKKNKYFKIQTKDEKIISSADHLFFLKDGDTKPAEDLSVGDLLLSVSEPKIITAIKMVTAPIELIDISVENQNFIANGLIVHNSAHRFERVREGMAKDFFKKIGDAAAEIFRTVENLHGIIIGGPGPTKETFAAGFLATDIKNKVVAVKDTGYTGMQGLQELVNRSQDVLAREDIIEEKIAVDKFLGTLNKRPKFAAYGEEQIKRAIEMGAVDLLLISEDIDEDLAEQLSEKVESSGGAWQLISKNSREGEQLSALGGWGAVLRFPVE